MIPAPHGPRVLPFSHHKETVEKTRNDAALTTVFISMGFLLLILGIVLLDRVGWPGYLFMAGGIGLLLFNVLRLLGRRGTP